MSKTNLPTVSAAQAVITVEAASIALQATVDHAKLLGIAINVAITDSAGVMAGFLRMPGAFLHSIDIAIDNYGFAIKRTYRRKFIFKQE